MKLRTVLLGAPLPLAIFLVYGFLRLLSIQPPTESGMSEIMSTGFFFCAAAITYFTAVIVGSVGDMKHYGVYLALATLFLVMGIDESFMLHEAVESAIGNDLPLFLTYAAILLASVFVLRKATLAFYVGFAIFGGLGALAVLADQISLSGAASILGREFDYEQILEASGAMFAAVAFGIRSAQSLKEGLVKELQAGI